MTLVQKGVALDWEEKKEEENLGISSERPNPFGNLTLGRLDTLRKCEVSHIQIS